MSSYKSTAVALLTISLCLPIQAAAKQHVLASWQGDLNGDGTTQVVQITRRYVRSGHPMGGEVVISGRGHAWRHGRLNPWKLQVADVDGDGKSEVILGVWKKSPKDPVMAKRVFIYSWKGHRLLPKWLSSRLSRRFDDFALADVDHDGLAELFALEIVPGGKHRISEYRWRSFGCDWLGCTAEIDGVTGLQAVSDGIELTEAGGKRAKLDLATIRYWRSDENGKS